MFFIFIVYKLMVYLEIIATLSLLVQTFTIMYLITIFHEEPMPEMSKEAEKLYS